ncbi:M12 family metallo-peptidase, partial [bacterium]|nr:M12 family metallo-peptidase [bacterium]
HNGDYLNGKVEYQGRVLNLSAESESTVKVQEISVEKQDEKPICNQDSSDLHSHVEPSILKPQENSQQAPATNSIIDVLVVYSGAYASSYSNDKSKIQAQIETRIAEANVIFQRSQVGVTLVLLGAEEISLSDNTTSGSTVASSSEAKNLREQYGADLVSFWTVNGSAGSAQNYSGNSSYAYNTSRKRDIESRYTFVHEMGHNMGAKHDRATYVDQGRGDELTPSLYKYGKSFTNYRTVMSYDNCPSGNSCNRIMNFTNPEVDYNGVPTGIAYDPSNLISDKSTGPADNARRFNETRSSIEGFRTRKVSVSSVAQSSSQLLSSSVQQSSDAQSSVAQSSSIQVSSSSVDNSGCSGVAAWESSKGYSGKDDDGDGTPDSPIVSHDGNKYALTAWWSQGNNPTSSSNIWKNLGVCNEGQSSSNIFSSQAQSSSLVALSSSVGQSSSEVIVAVAVKQKPYVENGTLYTLGQKAQIEVFNLHGRILKSFSVGGAVIDTPLKLHSGQYLVLIKMESGTEWIKVNQN